MSIGLEKGLGGQEEVEGVKKVRGGLGKGLQKCEGDEREAYNINLLFEGRGED